MRARARRRSRTRRRSREGRRAGLAALTSLALAAVALGACASGGAAGLDAGGADRVLAGDPVPSELYPLVDSIQAALRAGDDAVAWRLLAALRARDPRGRALELADGFERVLVGRRLVRSLEWELETAPVSGDPSRYELRLVVRHAEPEELVVELAPPTLRRIEVGVDPLGNEYKGAYDELRGDLSTFTIPPGRPVVRGLGEHELRLGDALAMRHRWLIELRSGRIRRGGEAYPAKDPGRAAAERVRRAPYLPEDELGPEALVEYAQGDEVSTPALLERAVRIPLERGEEALDRLTAVLPRLSDERVGEIVPALRWLSRTSAPGGSAAAWRRWLAARRARERAERADVGALDLPVGSAHPDPSLR